VLSCRTPTHLHEPDLVQLGFDSEAYSVGVRNVSENGRPDRITIYFVLSIADDKINACVDSFKELE